jgi:hypothetical protein
MRMAKKRARIAEGATFEEVEALLLKVTRQLRTMAPPPHVAKNLDQIEAQVELMMARGEGKLLLH